MLGGLVSEYVGRDHVHVPGASEDSTIFCHAQVSRGGAPLAPTLSALLRESFELFVQGGVHLACSHNLQHQAAFQSWASIVCTTGTGVPCRAACRASCST